MVDAAGGQGVEVGGSGAGPRVERRGVVDLAVVEGTVALAELAVTTGADADGPSLGGGGQAVGHAHVEDLGVTPGDDPADVGIAEEAFYGRRRDGSVPVDLAPRRPVGTPRRAWLFGRWVRPR